MSLYEVEFTETLQKTIEVEAEDEYEAYLIAKRMYRKAEVILMAEDYIDTEIDVRLKSLG
ncbi:DpnD/PcfM family protein [Floccifex sp.]|uniref:DpnD/PcfM family protein n=1 Tax=Floccifex sp. TaxID=2815810 RepID=UPI002A747EF3|nr:DpnD/PcfM family protein [Floccifex sp.]MDD7280907.1 DpnD/PcfM family protein [Erysipelotrichaceae bacterium]MDY2958578.1 DpnD/PcfM family protein [Floccifex sp.]